MSNRERRIGANEAVFRKVNEQIESLNRGMAEVSDMKLHIVCECGDLNCVERLVVEIDDYERIRADRELFLIKEGHETPDVEDVVEHTDAYEVVRKHGGDPAEYSDESDAG